MTPIDLTQFDGITPGQRTIMRPKGSVPLDERNDIAVRCGDTLIAEFFHHRNQHGNPRGVYQDPTADANSLCLVPDLIAELKACRVVLAKIVAHADADRGRTVTHEDIDSARALLPETKEAQS